MQETVLEGMPKGTKVTQVEAVDHDGTYPNSKVSTFVNHFAIAHNRSAVV